MTDPTKHEQCTCDHEDRYHFTDGTGFVVCRATTECLCTWREKAVTSNQRPTLLQMAETALGQWLHDFGSTNELSQRSRIILKLIRQGETNDWHGVEKLAGQRNAALLSVAKLLPYAQQHEPADAAELDERSCVVEEAEKVLAGYIPAVEPTGVWAG